MKILITGGAGFLGRECAAQLRSAGHAVVTTDKQGGVDIVADLANPDDVRRLPDVETVVHSAAVRFSPMVLRRILVATASASA